MNEAGHRAVAVGDPAPDFALPDQSGIVRRFSEIRSRDGVPGPAVLYFYPGNFTPICTKEACAFRDAYSDFVDAGATVIGVSSDTAESHARFAGAMRLDFTLLSDSTGDVRRLYGVPKSFGLFAGRVTYVIDAAGIVRLVYNAPLRAGRHVRSALELVRSLAFR